MKLSNCLVEDPSDMDEAGGSFRDTGDALFSAAVPRKVVV